MITKAPLCPCGNRETADFREYDGLLGYEAVVCLKCGRYWDNEVAGFDWKSGTHKADDWSINYIGGIK
jgi:hypothetical protein